MPTDAKIFEVPGAWRASDFKNSAWIDTLSASQRKELNVAAASLPEDETAWLDWKREDLNLPTLKPLLEQTNNELEKGRGFAVIRGIDLSAEDVTQAYRVNWVLALGLGNVIAQNANGEVIGAVQAVVQANDNGLNTRGYVSNAELRFHCDGGDVASLLCVRQAPEGGMNTLVSMVTIHNTMVRECPEHLDTLYKGLQVFMRKEGNFEGGSMPRRPMFYPQDDHILAWINLRLMELPYEAEGAVMPAAERAALDALEEIAERPENALRIKLLPGDMLLTHNFVCMHKRSHFVDDPDPAKARLMLRLWYNIKDGRVEAIQPEEQRSGPYSFSPLTIRHR